MSLDGFRMADDPQHVALPGTRSDGPRSAQDDMNVGAPYGRIVGAIGRLYSDSVAETAQRPREGFGKVPITPARRDLARWGRDRDGDAQRCLDIAVPRFA